MKVAAGFFSISIGLDFFVSFFSLHSLVFPRNVVVRHFSSKLQSKKHRAKLSAVELLWSCPIKAYPNSSLPVSWQKSLRGWSARISASETWSPAVCTKSQPLHQCGLSFVFSKYVRTNQFPNYNVSTYKNDLCSLCSYTATKMHIEIVSYKLCSTRCDTFSCPVFVQSDVNQSNKVENWKDWKVV